MRKPAFCICENEGADQLCCNREADQRLCFRYTDSTIPLLPKSEISSLKPSSVVGGRTGLMVRASDSGSGDPGSILGRVGVFVSLSKRHLLPKSTGNTQE